MVKESLGSVSAAERRRFNRQVPTHIQGCPGRRSSPPWSHGQAVRFTKRGYKEHILNACGYTMGAT